MNKSWKIGIGVFLLLVSLLVKAYFNHNYDTYSSLYTFNTVLNVIVLMILFYPVFSKINEQKPVSFQLYPKKWLISNAKLFGTMAMIVLIHVVIQDSGAALNKAWVNYQIDKAPVSIVGEVVKEDGLSLIGRYKETHQRFVVIRYTVNENDYLLRTTIEGSHEVEPGKRIMVKYLQEDPSLAMLDEIK